MTGGCTMTELARAAGLDVSTVSRALRGDSRRVSRRTIARVHDLARDLGYVPDPVAASLRGGSSRMIGVLVPRLTDAAMASLFDGIEREARQQAHIAVVSSTGSDQAVRDEVVLTHLRRRVDGFILADSLIGQPLPGPLSEPRHVPYVLAFRRLDHHRSISADDHQGGRLVAAHLLERGHRNLAVVGGPKNVPTVGDRAAGFVEHVAASSPNAAVRSVHTGLEAADGYRAAQQLLSSVEPPTAFFAVNDFSAIGVIRAVQDHGLEAGRDVAVVGYNDAPVTALLHTPLSTVRTNLSAIGARAVRALLADETGSATLETEFVLRASSDFWL
jgi:LacI family transcriptional regulator